MPTKPTCPPCTANCEQGDWCPSRQLHEERGLIVTAVLVAVTLAVPFWIGVHQIATWAWGLVP